MECGIEFIQLHELDSAFSLAAKMNCDGFLFHDFILSFRCEAKKNSHIIDNRTQYFTSVWTLWYVSLHLFPSHIIFVAIGSRVMSGNGYAPSVHSTHQIQVAVMISHLIHCVPAAPSTAFAYSSSSSSCFLFMFYFFLSEAKQFEKFCMRRHFPSGTIH